MKIGPYWVHRKEQWDLGVNPIVCVHKVSPNTTERVFCLAIKNKRLKAWV